MIILFKITYLHTILLLVVHFSQHFFYSFRVKLLIIYLCFIFIALLFLLSKIFFFLALFLFSEVGFKYFLYKYIIQNPQMDMLQEVTCPYTSNSNRENVCVGGGTVEKNATKRTMTE